MTDGIIQKVFKQYIDIADNPEEFRMLQQELIAEIKKEFAIHAPEINQLKFCLIGDNQE